MNDRIFIIDEKEIVINHCFNSMSQDDYVSFLLTRMSQKKYGSSGNPYISITFSDYFDSDEEGYFGERKARFIDRTYTDKIARIVEVSYEEFHEILTKQTEKYLKNHEDEREKAEKLMLEIKKQLEV